MADIKSRAAMIVLCGLLAALAAGTMNVALAGSTGGSIDEPGAGTIGGAIDEKDKMPPGANQEVPGDTSFDGIWASAAVAETCKGRVSGIFKVLNGRLFAAGVSGRIGADGSARGVNHYKGYLITWTGQFSGGKALGQWRRNDGCTGSWEAVRE